MKISIILGIIAARITTFFLRLAGSGGTSLPGKTAMLFNKNLLGYLASDIKVIMITGTNGKTTTSRIISEILLSGDFTFFENKSGANLISGITASFAMNCTLTGKPKYKYAVIECDEAAFKTVCPLIRPHFVIVTNLFRDQLDRYGEITHTRNNIIMGLVASPGTKVILNADDSLSYSIKDRIANDVHLYGLNSPPYGVDEDFLSDAPYCIRCKSPYTYKYRTYAHLGSFKCSSCGYSREKPEYYCGKMQLNSDSSEVTLAIGNKKHKAIIALPGAYNIYNALSAAATAHEIGIEPEIIISALSTFKSGFGRMEKLSLTGNDVNMILVKNPAGLNQVINYLSSDSKTKILVMILNDKFADGTDISWIWDVNFEKINSFSDSIMRILVSGKRGEELRLRFKYAGIPVDKVETDKDYNSLINKITTENRENLPVYVLPTYTAMFDFRKVLSKRYKIRKFWK